MKLEKALLLIAKFEGCNLEAYPDPATGGVPWTIGFGSTRLLDGSPVLEGMVISQSEADELLANHIADLLEQLSKLILVELNENQLCACLSLAYNIGIGNFKKSSVLRNINKSDVPQAAVSFLLFNKANGQVMQGLVRRRNEEMILFLS